MDDNGIDYKNYTHDAFFTVEDSKSFEHNIPATHAKTLFVKNKKWNFVMITLLSHKKLDSKFFRNQSWLGDFSFASPDELRDQLRVRPWSVGIFGLINNPAIHLYIDSDIWNSEYIWRHPNDNTSTTVISSIWLCKYLKILDIKYDILEL